MKLHVSVLWKHHQVCVRFFYSKNESVSFNIHFLLIILYDFCENTYWALLSGYLKMLCLFGCLKYSSDTKTKIFAIWDPKACIGLLLVLIFFEPKLNPWYVYIYIYIYIYIYSFFGFILCIRDEISINYIYKIWISYKIYLDVLNFNILDWFFLGNHELFQSNSVPICCLLNF